MVGRGYSKRAVRVRVRTNGVLTESDGCRVPVVIVDLSLTGVRVECDAELTPGEVVTLQSGRHDPARVRIEWTRGREAGGTFLDAPPAI